MQFDEKHMATRQFCQDNAAHTRGFSQLFDPLLSAQLEVVLAYSQEDLYWKRVDIAELFCKSINLTEGQVQKLMTLPEFWRETAKIQYVENLMINSFIPYGQGYRALIEDGEYYVQITVEQARQVHETICLMFMQLSNADLGGELMRELQKAEFGIDAALLVHAIRHALGKENWKQPVEKSKL